MTNGGRQVTFDSARRQACSCGGYWYGTRSMEASCKRSCTTARTKAWEEVAQARLVDDTDAIVRVDATTICGTDLHILKGDVPAVTDGRILGHEAVGTVEEVGAGVKNVTRRRPGPRVVHHRVRRVPVLPRGPLRPVPGWRRLDPRAHDRRHPGRVRASAVRRHLDLSRCPPACPTRRS